MQYKRIKDCIAKIIKSNIRFELGKFISFKLILRNIKQKEKQKDMPMQEKSIRVTGFL